MSQEAEPGDDWTPGRDNAEWIHDGPYGHLHLRDFFAAFAMAGIIASDGNPHAIGEKWTAAAAYTMVEAMLAQREQR